MDVFVMCCRCSLQDVTCEISSMNERLNVFRDSLHLLNSAHFNSLFSDLSSVLWVSFDLCDPKRNHSVVFLTLMFHKVLLNSLLSIHVHSNTVHCWLMIVKLAARSAVPVAPEAVWQVGRPPYQSEIWYGGAIPIRDAAISVVLYRKTRKKLLL